jgi:hypothetical protein
MNGVLFQTGDFTLASGAKSDFKIECDAFSPADWEGLALMASKVLPPFGEVLGVPRGGIPFADALRKYATKGKTLLAEDVCTTGGSITRYRDGIIEAEEGFTGNILTQDSFIGVCVFARGPVPPWVTPLFPHPGLLLAVRKHHAMQADDRCWMDDIELYRAAGLPTDNYDRIGSPSEMLKNCERFITLRCAEGGPWVSYAELEKERNALRAFKDWVHTYLDDKGVPHHPPGIHGAAGCRIGDRMDWVFAEIERLKQQTAEKQ